MFFFLLFGRGPRPRPNSEKKQHAPAQTAKNETRPRPFRACCFFAVWVGGCVYVFAVWAGGVFFFCCLGGGRVLFFAVWAGVVFFFCCLGGGREGTGVHSLTGLPGSSLSNPTTKKTKQQKKKKKNTGSGLGFRRYLIRWGSHRGVGTTSIDI